MYFKEFGIQVIYFIDLINYQYSERDIFLLSISNYKNLETKELVGVETGEYFTDIFEDKFLSLNEDTDIGGLDKSHKYYILPSDFVEELRANKIAKDTGNVSIINEVKLKVNEL